MKDGWDSLSGAAVDGVDAATSAWTADMCKKTIGKGPSTGEETKYAPQARAAQDRALAPWPEFDVFCPRARANFEKTIVDTRSAA